MIPSCSQIPKWCSCIRWVGKNTFTICNMCTISNTRIMYPSTYSLRNFLIMFNLNSWCSSCITYIASTRTAILCVDRQEARIRLLRWYSVIMVGSRLCRALSWIKPKIKEQIIWTKILIWVEQANSHRLAKANKTIKTARSTHPQKAIRLDLGQGQRASKIPLTPKAVKITQWA